MSNWHQYIGLSATCFFFSAVSQFIIVDWPNCAFAGVGAPLAFCAAGCGVVMGYGRVFGSVFESDEGSRDSLSRLIAFFLGAWTALIVSIPPVWAGEVAGRKLSGMLLNISDSQLCAQP